MLTVASAPHTARFGRTAEDRCPTCLSRDCLHRTYNPKLLRFISKHFEVYGAAYFDRGPASNQLERLNREYRTLPPRHVCTCDPGHCGECRRLDRERPMYGDVAAQVGRTGRPSSTTPDVALLDLAMAASAGIFGPGDIASWLSGQRAQTGT